MATSMNPPAPRVIHVLGSVGRTSIATMIAALLQASGERTAIISATYLHSPRERLIIDGQPLAREVAAGLLALTNGFGDETQFVERALAHVEHEQVRSVIINGLPCRRIAAVGVWAPVLPGVNETAAAAARRLLEGSSAAAGVVVAPQRESVLDCLRNSLPSLTEVAQRCAIAYGRSGLDGQDLRLRTPRADYRLALPLLGRFQAENAATAILAVEQLAPDGVELTPAQAGKALQELRLAGRLEVVKRRPLVIVDTGERPEALRRAAQTLRDDLALRRCAVVLASSGEWPAARVIDALGVLQPSLIATAPPSGGLDPSLLARAAFDAGLTATVAPDCGAAVDAALEEAGPSGVVFITGARALAAAARAYLLGLMPADIDLS